MAWLVTIFTQLTPKDFIENRVRHVPMTNKGSNGDGLLTYKYNAFWQAYKFRKRVKYRTVRHVIPTGVTTLPRKWLTDCTKNIPSFAYLNCSVTNPGCLSRIRIFSVPDPGPKRFPDPRSRGQKCTGSRIRNTAGNWYPLTWRMMTRKEVRGLMIQNWRVPCLQNLERKIIGQGIF